jgi:short subunit dehydrogenase-like uncharacterized protein
MKTDILLYGANGYTAGLILELAMEAGTQPIVAGRSREKLAPIAEQYGLPLRVFGLDDPTIVAQNLAGVAVVLNCAGPFSRTAVKMAEGCIQTGVHYLDITGEIEVFESLARMGSSAELAGVMLMPGTGFDVVPSDCLATHLKRRLPDATSLTLAFHATGQVSHGTATTMVENLHRGGVIRRNGQLMPVPAAWATRDIDFGSGPTKVMSIPWGDVSTAWFSTGIPDIEVFIAAPTAMRVMAKVSRYLGPVIGSGTIQRWLKGRIDAAPAGPDAEQRQMGSAHLWGEIRNASGKTAASRLDTIEGYALTALTAWDIAKRCVTGEAKPGFKTPSSVFGPDYIMNFPDTTRIDL